jgi:hypothetical protein
MSNVIDVLFIKQIEKEIGRKLDEIELDQARYGETIFVQTKRGTYFSFVVPLLEMPRDLMKCPQEYDAIMIRHARSVGGCHPWNEDQVQQIQYGAGGIGLTDKGNTNGDG